MDSYDLDLAKQYIEASGIDPTTVEFSIICSDDVKRRSGEVIQANLKELGITVNLESMDLATYLSTVADGDFDAAIGGYTSTNMMSVHRRQVHHQVDQRLQLEQVQRRASRSAVC